MTQKYLKLCIYSIKGNFLCGEQIKISHKAQMCERNCGVHTKFLKVYFEIEINGKKLGLKRKIIRLTLMFNTCLVSVNTFL